MNVILCLLTSVFSIALCATQLLAAPYITSGDVPVDRGFRKEFVIQGLEHPWGMAWLPNGDMLITERPGRLRLVRDGRLIPDPVKGIPEVFAAGQGGLLDVLVHPRFEENRAVYLTYAYGTSKSNRTRVARALFDGSVLMDLQVIFEVSIVKPGSQHFGSRLLWLPDGTLLVSIGDGGNPPIRMKGDWIRKQAQNRRSHLGKILRLKEDGSTPRDNPFFDSADSEATVWSYGHRNIQGLTYDPLRSMVWASEHGALGGDELNVIEAGKNYGWPVVTYSREYFGGIEISPYTSKPGMVNPRVVWLNAIAPSGLVVYTGKAFPHWYGDIFAGGLISQDIRHIALDEAGNVIEQHALRVGQRVRDVRQGPDGLLYVLTDESRGSLIRFKPASEEKSEAAP
jgi:glucose/arabinose dehydrogenase